MVEIGRQPIDVSISQDPSLSPPSSLYKTNENMSWAEDLNKMSPRKVELGSAHGEVPGE